MNMLLFSTSTTISKAALTDYETNGVAFLLRPYVKIAIVYWNALFLVAFLILRTSLSAALTMAAGLSGCAIKGKLQRETGFSPFEEVGDHHTDGLL